MTSPNLSQERPTAPDARPLVGSVVRLELATPDDAAELFTALDDERVWAAGHGGGPAGRPRDAEGTEKILRAALSAHARGERVPYVVRLVADGPLGAAGTVVGTTSIGDVDLVNERAHVGWTAYGVSWWGTAVNPECKLLLLGHAFDDCGLGRIKIQTDAINTRSQAAIAKLGATREGVLRRHLRRADGTFRDTVVFSVLKDEWPAVRQGLLERLHPSA
ncbi:MAG: GNAT family N-acetyltransferase [Motilibacteraceae bacterium]